MNGVKGGGRLVRPRRKSQAEVQQPVLDFRCHCGGGNGLSFGVCEVQGYRPHMEDRHVAKVSVQPDSDVYKDVGFFAVFDGHGGDWVSSMCAKDSGGLLEFMKADQQLTQLLAEQSPICDYRQCLRRLFLAYDCRMKRQIDFQRNRDDSCGSTAVVLFICKRHLLLANCGDSRGVVYIDYGNYYNRVTVDHSVSHVLSRDISSVELRAERKRFEGLRYEMDRDRGLRRPGDKLGHGLMITRAFGDYDFKGDDLHNLVTAEPAINHGAYFLKGQERLAVLASDGIWDVFGTEDVCEFALAQLRRRPNVESVCRDVAQSAMEAGSRDNMTILIVCFDKNVERGTELNSLRRESGLLCEFLARRLNGREPSSLSDQEQSQLLLAACQRLVGLSVASAFGDSQAEEQPAKCFSRVAFFFWQRRARHLFEKMMRNPEHLRMPALTETDDS